MYNFFNIQKSIFCINFKFFLIKKTFFIVFFFESSLGYKSFLISNFVLVDKNRFLLRFNRLSQFFRTLDRSVFGILFGWFTKLLLLGYNYKIKTSSTSKFLLVFLGFFYSFLIYIPKSISVFIKNRVLTICGNCLLDFNFFVFFLRNLRDLYPYKTRGLVFSGESFVFKKTKRLK